MAIEVKQSRRADITGPGAAGLTAAYELSPSATFPRSSPRNTSATRAASPVPWSITNQFGRRLINIFFKTYTEKVWASRRTSSQPTGPWRRRRDCRPGSVWPRKVAELAVSIYHSDKRGAVT
jgi:hypothetical protein